MKMISRITLTLGFAFALVLVSSCSDNASSGSSEYPGFEQTESGLYYKFHISNPDAQKPVENDFITGIGIYKVGDTTFFDSRQTPNPYSFPIMPSTHKGDIFEGIRMMGLGDSATFIIPADSLFLKTFRTGTLPPFVDSGAMAYLDFKIMKIQSREEFEAQMQADAEARNPELAEARMQEPALLQQYLTENNITTAPTESGLIYIEETVGTGAQPQPGQTVQVHYTGTLLDGTKFDSSVDRGEPFQFVLGQGQVIKGWDEGIAMMKEGGTARLIIPSAIAYGSRAMGTIKPYSTLVFEVELIKVGE